MAKAKRRKVWVTFEGEAPTWVEASAKMAKAQHLMGEERPVAFVEHRPGDVVLSREDKADLAARAEKAEAERDALRARDVSDHPGGALLAGELRKAREALEAVRALCARFERGGGTLWPGEILAAMDGAKS